MSSIFYSFRAEFNHYTYYYFYHHVFKRCNILVNLYKAVITLLKNNEKPENNTRDLSIGYLLVALTYSIIGSLFFLTFPDNKGLDGDTTGVIGH